GCRGRRRHERRRAQHRGGHGRGRAPGGRRHPAGAPRRAAGQHPGTGRPGAPPRRGTAAPRAQGRPRGAHRPFRRPAARPAPARRRPLPPLVLRRGGPPGGAALGRAHVQSFHSIAADPTTPLAHGERPESPGRLAGEAMLARDSDFVVAVSRAEAATVTERLGGSRVALAPPGVDTVPFHPAADDGGYVLVAARLEPLKGIDLAIAALGAMPAQERPPLVVVGGPTARDGGYLEELRALAAAHGVAAGFPGPQSRPRLAQTMRRARLLLVPSHSETYGLVALEAAASGVPVVAAASGGLAEAVVDGVTGVLRHDRDPRTWARGGGDLLRDRARAAAVGEGGRRHAVAHTWQRTARRLVGAYRAVLPA